MDVFSDEPRERASASQHPDKPLIDWILAGLATGVGHDGKRLTRRGLARTLSVNESIITRMLDGHRRVKHEEIMKIANYLGSPPPDIFGGADLDRRTEIRTHAYNPDQPYIDWIVATMAEMIAPNGRRLTQTGLAKALGIDHAQVNRMLKGKRRLKHWEIPKIASYLGSSPPNTYGVGANTALDGAAVANPDQPYIGWIIAALENNRGPDGKRLTRRGLSRVLGVSEPVITRLLAGDRRLMHYEIPKIAAYLGSAPPVLPGGVVIDFPGASPRLQNAPFQHVPVKGECAGGRWMEYELGDNDYETVPVVPTKFPNLEQFAYRVRGNSMDKQKILDGDYVVCVPYFMARAKLTHDDIVVVERRRGGLYERTCKALEEQPDGRMALMARSTDARHDGPLFVSGDHVDATEEIEIEVVGLVVGRYSPI